VYNRDGMMNLPLLHHIDAIMPIQDSQNQFSNLFQANVLGKDELAFHTLIMPGIKSSV
jgi:hypothetical protein